MLSIKIQYRIYQNYEISKNYQNPLFNNQGTDDPFAKDFAE